VPNIFSLHFLKSECKKNKLLLKEQINLPPFNKKAGKFGKNLGQIILQASIVSKLIFRFL
jgi:hypothetical protein